MAETRTTPAADPAYNPADPTTRQTGIDNPPDGKLMVTYHPGLNEPRQVEAFGKRFKAGEAIEVEPQFRGKVRGNPFFSIEGERSAGDEKREAADQEQEVEYEDDNLTFDENVVANRMEEYGTSDPETAEQIRRSGETSFARAGAPRKRGRPSKDQARAEAKARAEAQEAELADIRKEQGDEAEIEDERKTQIESARAEQARQS